MTVASRAAAARAILGRLKGAKGARQAATLCASMVQAGVSLLTFLAVGQLLTPEGFTTFSNTIATAFWLNSLCFEWARISANRFFHYNDARGGDGQVVFSSLIAGQAVGAIVALAACSAASLLGVMAPQTAILCFIVALGQGFGDLSLAMLRMSGRLTAFSAYSLARATACLIAAAAAAAVSDNPYVVLLTFGSVGLTFALLCAVAQRHLYRFSVRRVDIVQIRHFLIFGGAAGLASVIHQLGLLGVRWQAALALPPAQAAALALSFDLLFRPFAVLAVSVNGAMMPDAVREHRLATQPGGPTASWPQLRRLLSAFLWMQLVCILVAVPAIGILSQHVVQSEVAAYFVADLASMSVLCLSAVLLQAFVAIPLQLTQHKTLMILNAVLQTALITGLSYLSLRLGAASLFAPAAMVGAVFALLIGMAQFRLLPGALPKTDAVFVGLIICIAATGMAVLPTDLPSRVIQAAILTVVSVCVFAVRSSVSTLLQRRMRGVG